MAWAMRLARRVGFGKNSLRRPVDRVDGLVVGLTVLVAVAIPVGGVFAGIELAHYEAAVSAEQQATRTATTAVLVEDSAQQNRGAKTGEGTGGAMARWTGPDGTQHTGRIDVATGQSAGKTVTIWVDRNGRATSAPIEYFDAMACAVVIALVGVAVAESLLLGLVWLLRWPMDLWRDKAWDHDWERAAARWKQGMV